MTARPLHVLGIETSCDETAVAIVNDAKEICVNLVLSQKEHADFGGVVPEVAARAHLNHIDTMVAEALKKTGLGFDDLDAIAVTAGPGLIGGVFVGVMTAKAISAVRGIPLIAVNHLEGHALTCRLTDDVAFPYLLLLASGGHCQILIVHGVGDYTRLGGTIDDAAGEAFDKTAKLLGLGYPGGPALEKKALLCTDPSAARRTFIFPRPLTDKKGCDFSFSGLKTAARRMIEQGALKTDSDIPAFCFSFQETIADILADRLHHALDLYRAEQPAQPTLVVAGGVAANKTIRARLETLAQKADVRFTAPPLPLCTDNAAMIAWAGIERFKLGKTDRPDFPVYARWPLDMLRNT